jgi:hypothetical protein
MKYKTKQTQARLNEYACCYVFMTDLIIIILESNSCVFILTWWESAFQDLIISNEWYVWNKNWYMLKTDENQLINRCYWLSKYGTA